MNTASYASEQQTAVKQASLGFWKLTALVAGNMIGSGVFLLPASLAHYGGISLLAWLFTSAGALLLAQVFARLGAQMPQAGGPYAYCRAAFGDFIGFQVAWNYWMALWVGNAAMVVAFTGYLSYFWKALGTSPGLSCSVNLAVVWLITLLNAVSVRAGVRFQAVTTALKLLPLLLAAAVGLWFIQPAYFLPFNASGLPALSAFNASAVLILWSFIGLESASIPVDYIEDPKRNIPRATKIGVGLAALLYVLSYVAVVGLVPPLQLRASNAPYAEAAYQLLGPIGSIAVAAFAALSCLGALSGWILLQGQVPQAAARDKLFPAIFLKENARGVPIAGLVLSSLFISLLLLLKLNERLVDQFTFIVLLATLSSLLPYFYTAMAALRLFQTAPTRSRLANRCKGLAAPVLTALLAGTYTFWAILSAGQEIVFYGFLLWLSSVPIYVWMLRNRRNLV